MNNRIGNTIQGVTNDGVEYQWKLSTEKNRVYLENANGLEVAIPRYIFDGLIDWYTRVVLKMEKPFDFYKLVQGMDAETLVEYCETK